ncbi:hypothetical protein EON65_45055 [archaeon]|nr:MAG: hypothetical protein EON65_45055 [archaeon]
MKDNGYTEAELAAAAWRKQQMLAKSTATNKDVQRKPSEETRMRDRKSSSYYRSQSRTRSRSVDRSHKDRKRDRSRSRSERRERRPKEHRTGREHRDHRYRDHTEQRGETRSHRERIGNRDSRPRENHSEPELDEFGRIMPKGAKRRVPEKSPSHSRSRSRSRHREDKWRHDKFSSAEYDDRLA